MPKIKGTELVEKRNILNEIRKTNMTLQQLRFFSIYLAKINARDLSTRIVRFPLSDFQKIMGLGRMNIQHFKNTVDRHIDMQSIQERALMILCPLSALHLIKAKLTTRELYT